MPVTHVSKIFAVKDAKISVVTADASGASTTYGTAIDVPGIKSVAISGDVTNVELRGDNTLLDSASVLSGIEVEFEYAKLSLDVMTALLGPATTDAGTTPNQTATFGLTATNATFNYFKFQAVSQSADPLAGDVLITLYKCILSEFPEMGLAEEDYQTLSVTAKALPALGTGLKWIDYAIRETTAVLT